MMAVLTVSTEEASGGEREETVHLDISLGTTRFSSGNRTLKITWVVAAVLWNATYAARGRADSKM